MRPTPSQTLPIPLEKLPTQTFTSSQMLHIYKSCLQQEMQLTTLEMLLEPLQRLSTP